MLSVSEAFSLILRHTLSLPTEEVSIIGANGRVLREDIVADRDLPPFDRITMDGIALRYETFATGQRTFAVVGMHLAGQPQPTLSDPAACLEVMTGATLPIGADTVIRYEDVTVKDGQAIVNIDAIKPQQNIHKQGSDRQAGEVLLSAGTLLGPTQIAVAAGAGKVKLLVSALPKVVLISTGDELVNVGDTPLPHQIRQSNTYMLGAALQTMGIAATIRHIIDDAQVLRQELETLLNEYDLLILSGGVSAGKADFVPAVLQEIGVREVFHKLAQRPGKPLWFGTQEYEEGRKVVFGLPGNPVSTFMCMYRYIKPFLQASFGQETATSEYAALAEPISFAPALTYFVPVRLASGADGQLLAHPLPGSGSGDYGNLTAADAFLELPADRTDFAPGEAFPIWRYR